MLLRFWVSTVCLAIIPVTVVWARPSVQESQIFDAQIAQEISDFEASLKKSEPNPRAKAIQEFEQTKKQKVADFQARLLGFSAGQKSILQNEFASELAADQKAFNEKLKTIGPDTSNLQDKRKKFMKQIQEKMTEFYA